MKKIIKNTASLLLSFALLLSFSVPALAAGFNVGATEGNIYSNEFFGKRLVLPEGYAFLEGETLASEVGLTLDELNDTEGLAKTITDGDSVIICYAYDDTGVNNINISLAYIGMDDEKQIVEILKEYLGNLYKSYGYTVNGIEIEERQVAGETHYMLNVDLMIQDIGCYQKSVVFIKDGYAMTTTASAYTAEEAERTVVNLESMN